MKSLDEIARLTGGRLVGPGEAVVGGIAALDEAGATELSFLTDTRYADRLARTRAGAVMLAEDYPGSGPGCPEIRVADVPAALERLLEALAPAPDHPAAGIDPTAVIDPSARIGAGAAIAAQVTIGPGAVIGERAVLYPGCRIGRDVVVGDDCVLYANVVVNWGCRLGRRVIIHPNSTIGADGFGYRLVDGRHRKIPHIGIVVIEDDVEIGANSCVDRAKFGRTTIGENTKIDNLVQVGHNVTIGPSCILVAQVGLAGSCRLGRYVVLGGQVGVADHAEVADGAMVAAKTGVISQVKPGDKVMGMPARPIREYFRQQSLLNKLPELFKEFKQTQKKLERIAEPENHSR